MKKNKQVEEKIVPDIDDCYKLALARFEMEMLENTNKNEELWNDLKHPKLSIIIDILLADAYFIRQQYSI